MAYQSGEMEKFAAEKKFLEYLNGYPAQPEWLTAMTCGIEQEELDPLELKQVRQQKELLNVLNCIFFDEFTSRERWAFFQYTCRLRTILF